LDVTSVSGNDLSSILVATEAGGHPCPAPPDLPPTDTPLLVPIGPGAYHSGGLAPWGVENFWVVTSNMFTPSKWCRWHLSNQEV
jgi:hypothetical protein